jgi:hypothetical protein
MEALTEPTYWEMVMDRPTILLPPLLVYVFFCWGIPLLGCLDEGIRPYLRSVLEVSGCLHAAVIVTGLIAWIAYPYVVIS